MKQKIIGLCKNKYYLLSSVLIFLSFPSYDHWFLKGFPIIAWISLVPLFIYLKGKCFKDILYISFVTGFWGNYLAFNWIGHFGASVKGGYYVVLLFLIPSLTIFFITKIAVAEILSRRYEFLRIFIYPSVWICVDWAQSIGFLAFPWTYWGYSQFPFTSFIQISSFTGIMGVTFILVLSNYIISDYIHIIIKGKISVMDSLKSIEFQRIVFIFIFVITVTGFGFFILKTNKSNNKDLKVTMIQSCISPWENWKNNRFQYLEHLEYYTNLALSENPDMIIWSESATLENISYHYRNGGLNQFEQKVLDIAKQSKKPLLTGEIGIIEDYLNKRYYPQNNAVLINKDGEVVTTYPKINLVPFGEWFPYAKWLTWFPYLNDTLIKFGASNFIPGDEPVLFNVNERKFGVLICYEGIFYRLCRTYKKLGSEFLINITNDGWTDSYAGHIQHYAASRFRAVENGIWYVRAGNTGFTALIDPFGRLIDSIPILKPGYLTGDIDFSLNHETFYSKFGDIFLYVIMIFTLCITASLIFKGDHKNRLSQ